ncbi:MAG: DUF3052 domain-containing protein [Acidimicrobiales bacterium]
MALLDAPAGVLDDPGPGVTLRRRAQGRADVVVASFTERRVLEGRIERLARMVHPDGGLWICWPKRASKTAINLTDDVGGNLTLPLGLVDNKVCAVDATWTAPRLVVRRRYRT